MVKTIFSLLESKEFENQLNDINSNFFNIKQECQIRDRVVFLLNSKFLKASQKALAEYPRENGKRRDLTIINKTGQNSFSIEFKFQFTNDYKKFLDYDRFIENDFHRTVCDKCCDMFILIVAFWNKNDKFEFEKQWDIAQTYTTSRFLSVKDSWRLNIESMFKRFASGSVKMIPIIVKEPYLTNYNFYILSRNVDYLRVTC